MATNMHAPSTRLADLLAAQPKDVVAAVCAPSQQSELTGSEVVEVAELLGIDFAIAPFSVEDLQLGLEVELEIEHECAPSMVDALDEDLVELGIIAVSNLQERSDYYTQLTQACAPGDPPLPRHEHADVGAD
jgi:hypothetical protein